MENEGYNFFEKFIAKMFIGMFLLFAVVILDKFAVVSYDNIKESLSSNINVLKAVKTVNGKINLIPLDLSGEIAVSLTAYENKEKIDGGYKILQGDYEAVENYKDGVIIKRIKKENGCYQITVLGLDDVTYIYDDLTYTDTHIYQFVKSGEIIGKASFNGENYFTIYSYKDGTEIDLFD